MRADCRTAVGQIKSWQQNVMQHHLVFVSSAGNRHGPVSTCRFSSAARRLSSNSVWCFSPSNSLTVTGKCQPVSASHFNPGWDTEDHHTAHSIWTPAQLHRKSEIHSVAVGRVRQGLKLKLWWKGKFTIHRILTFRLTKKCSTVLPFYLTFEGKLCVRESPTPCCTLELSHALTLPAAELTEWKIPRERCFQTMELQLSRKDQSKHRLLSEIWFNWLPVYGHSLATVSFGNTFCSPFLSYITINQWTYFLCTTIAKYKS